MLDHDYTDEELDEELGPELVALLASLGQDPKTMAPPGTPECYGSLIDSTISVKSGNGRCIACSHKKECTDVLAPQRDWITEGSCFGNPANDYRISGVKEYCYVCRVASECVAIRRQLPHLLTAEAPSTNPESLPTAVKAVVPAPSSPPPSASYNFPIDDILSSEIHQNTQKLTTPELISELSRLEAVVMTSEGTDYRPHRLAVCSVHLTLNERHAVLPRFRPGPRGDFRKAGRPRSNDDALIANDRRMFDVDWMAKHCPPKPSNEHAKLFSAGGLNYEKASAFVSTPGQAHKKAVLLAIKQSVQAQLATLQSTTMSGRWKALLSTRDQVMLSIIDAVDRNHGRRVDDPELLWSIHALDVLLDSNTAAIHSLSSLLGHHAPSRVKLGRQLQWLKEKAGL